MRGCGDVSGCQSTERRSKQEGVEGGTQDWVHLRGGFGGQTRIGV